MPFTMTNIKALEDVGPAFDGPEGLEFRAATKPLELEKGALSYQSLPPGCRFPYAVATRRADGLELLVVGAPNLGDDPRGDVDGERGWWAE